LSEQQIVEQFFSYMMARTRCNRYDMDDDVCFVLDQHN